MFQRTLRWRGVAVALGTALALGLAIPARAENRAAGSARQATALLQGWWADLWAAKASAPVSSPDPTGIEIEWGSVIDPNGRKDVRHTPPRASRTPRSTMPTGATFTCETIR